MMIAHVAAQGGHRDGQGGNSHSGTHDYDESSRGSPTPRGLSDLDRASFGLPPAQTLGGLLQAIAHLVPKDPEVCARLLATIGRLEHWAHDELDPSVTASISLTLEHHCAPKSNGHGQRSPRHTVRGELNPDGDAQENDRNHLMVPRLSGRPTTPMTPLSLKAVVPSPGDSEYGSAVSSSKLPWFPDETYGGLVRRCFALFEEPECSLGGKVIATVLVVTIAVSTGSFVLESLPQCRQRPPECAQRRALGLPLTVEACEPQPVSAFFFLEAVCIAVFSLDYLVRMLTVHAVQEGGGWLGALRDTLAYARQPLALVDLLAIVPFYADVLLSGRARFSKVLRLARVLRLFKLARRSPMIMMYAEVLRRSGQPLLILAFLDLIIVVVFSSLIYYVEGTRFTVDSRFTSPTVLANNTTMPARFPTGVYVRQDNDGQDMPTPFRSIPYGLWWVCTTVTTVGYGELVPTTAMGKVIGVACFYMGIICLALPISILGTNFNMIYERMLNETGGSIGHFRSRRRRPTAPARSPTPTRSADWEPSFWPAGPSLRRRIFLVFEDPTGSRLGKWVSMVVMGTILVSTVAFILESMPDLKKTPDECSPPARLTVDDCEPQADYFFWAMEATCVAIFTTDYVLRLVTVHAAHPEDCGLDVDQKWTPMWITVGYLRQVLNIIDLLAILPFYFEVAFGVGGGASIFRVLRLIRIFRVLRMAKLRSCAEMFIDVGLDAMPALVILLFMSSLAAVFFSSCMYYAESSRYSVDDRWLGKYPNGVYIRPTKDGYDLEPSPFVSIPYAFWFFFTTVCTIGYGDDYPTTTAGRCLGIGIFCSGIILLAMPITVIGNSFHKYYDNWVEKFARDERFSPTPSQNEEDSSSPHSTQLGSQDDSENAVPCSPPKEATIVVASVESMHMLSPHSVNSRLRAWS